MLSLCIPTFNGAARIGPLLESIQRQQCADVEVIIADNASTDETPELVRRFRKKVKHVTYTRAPSNRGFDANLRRAVQASRGSMCWFLGDDDALYPGAISRVLDTMKACPGAMIVGDVVARTMSEPRVSTYAESTAWPDYSAFYFDEPGTVARYLSKARSVRAGLPFIANVVFPRSAWPKDLGTWNATAYSHLAAWWRMVLDGVPVVTRRKALVYAGIGRPARRDADSLAYVRLDVDTIARIARLFPDARDRAAWRKLWRFEYPAWRRASLEERCKREASWLFVKHHLDRTLRGGTD